MATYDRKNQKLETQEGRKSISMKSNRVIGGSPRVEQKFMFRYYFVCYVIRRKNF